MTEEYLKSLKSVIFDFYDSIPQNYAEVFKRELDYLKQLNETDIKDFKVVFPYEFVTEVLKDIPNYIDYDKQAFRIGQYWSYVPDNFPFLYDLCVGFYCEQHEQSPHRYPINLLRKYEQTGGVIIDCGSSGCTFELQMLRDGIDISKFKFYLIDSDEQWNEPTRKTLKGLKINYEIINAKLGDGISLDSLMSGVSNIVCIKTDLEGYDLPTIVSAENIISQQHPIIMTATYHRQYDKDLVMYIIAQ